MKLYSDPYAPNVRRVLWTIAEKGIEDMALVPTLTLEGGHRDPDYVAKAGLPLVPALELDDGVVIAESLAICRYLESLYPDPNLFGRDPLETAIIEMWTRRTELMFATPLMLAVRNTLPALAHLGPQSTEFGAGQLAQAERALPMLEQRLTHGEWICGERLTIADIVAASGVGFAKLIKFQIPDAYPQLRRWAAAMDARPGARYGR